LIVAVILTAKSDGSFPAETNVKDEIAILKTRAETNGII
jgi:hypothetical protein